MFFSFLPVSFHSIFTFFVLDQFKSFFSFFCWKGVLTPLLLILQSNFLLFYFLFLSLSLAFLSQTASFSSSFNHTTSFPFCTFWWKNCKYIFSINSITAKIMIDQRQQQKSELWWKKNEKSGEFWTRVDEMKPPTLKMWSLTSSGCRPPARAVAAPWRWRWWGWWWGVPNTNRLCCPRGKCETLNTLS